MITAGDLFSFSNYCKHTSLAGGEGRRSVNPSR
jgi:hypothetical protein